MTTVNGRDSEIIEPRFANAVTYTVAVRVTVAGGARWPTGYRRAEKLAARLADTAARSPDTLEVTAVAGPKLDGETFETRPVWFAAATTGAAGTGLGDRYVDPDWRRAVEAVAAADAADRRRDQADRARRDAVGCANPSRFAWRPRRACGCVYCRPDLHLAVATAVGDGEWPTCLCGARLPDGGDRCPAHRDVALVVLDDDPPPLHQLHQLHDLDDREQDTQLAEVEPPHRLPRHQHQEPTR